MRARGVFKMHVSEEEERSVGGSMRSVRVNEGIVAAVVEVRSLEISL